MAEAGTWPTVRRAYVAIRGRIDAEDEFEDDAHRPLVLRRARIQLRATGSAWVTVDEHSEAVDFDVREGLDAIAIDHAALDAGLVVVPRESVGTAADAPDRVPAGTAPDDPDAAARRAGLVRRARHRRSASRRPARRPDRVRMTAGLGRPLVLTTLENARGDAHPGRRPGRAARWSRRWPSLSGLAAVTLGLAWAVAGRRDRHGPAPHRPTPAAGGGDPRSSGQGPGLVGDPLAAVLIVLAIGLAAAVADPRATCASRVAAAPGRLSPGRGARVPGPSAYWQEL